MPDTGRELSSAVVGAQKAMDAAWNTINDAQEQLRAAGVPDLIVDHMDEARLACMATASIGEVLKALKQLDKVTEEADA